MNKEKVYVYIGRFQIPHKGHEKVLKHAVENADRVVVLVGSSELARDPKNPFTFDERKDVLQGIVERLAQEEWSHGRTVNYDILPIHDYVYNNTKWLAEVQNQVQKASNSTDVTLTGCRKPGDASTEYLNFFPHWKNDFIAEEQHETSNGHNVVYSSTELREEFFNSFTVREEFTTPETIEFLSKFVKRNPEIMESLQKEYEYINRYVEQMQTQLPYNNIPFLTGDALVTCAGHILLVKRRTQPGKGLYALPGGFFDAWKDKDQIDTALRELKEETKIDVRFKELRGCIMNTMEFGDMTRSLRWRIITKCSYIKLDGTKLPKVKGSDDAEKAFWLPISEVIKNRDKFFEDHLSIIDTFLGIL